MTMTHSAATARFHFDMSLLPNWLARPTPLCQVPSFPRKVC